MNIEINNNKLNRDAPNWLQMLSALCDFVIVPLKVSIYPICLLYE